MPRQATIRPTMIRQGLQAPGYEMQAWEAGEEAADDDARSPLGFRLLARWFTVGRLPARQMPR